MNIMQNSLRPYLLHFRTPFKTSKQLYSQKKGFHLIIKDRSGFEGIGDIAPLPEFGTEDYNQAKKTIIDFLLKYQQTLKFKSPLQLDEQLKHLNDFPASRCGLEHALLNLYTNKYNVPLAQFFGMKQHKSIPVNATIGMLSEEDSINTIRKFLEQGFDTIKLKIGRQNPDDDIAIIKAIRNSIDNDFKLRLDANGAFDTEQAITLVSACNDLKIEYIEQPVSNLLDFTKIKDHTDIPLAADESIISYKHAKAAVEHAMTDIIIIKPPTIGGIIPAIKISNLNPNVQLVVTTSFESPLGKAYNVLLASMLPEGVAHGLYTESFFDQGFDDDIYPVINGSIHISE